MKGRGIAALALLYAPIHPSAWRDCLKKRDRFTKWSLLDRQKGSRRPRLVVLDHWVPTVESSSSLFQTVSEEEFSEVRGSKHPIGRGGKHSTTARCTGPPASSLRQTPPTFLRAPTSWAARKARGIAGSGGSVQVPGTWRDCLESARRA